MASKQPFKLIDIQMMATKVWLKANYFLKYNVMFQKKNILIIGDEQSQIYKSFTSKLKSGWSIHTVSQTQLAYPKIPTQNKETQYYHQIETRLKNKVYQSIVVLPSNNSHNFDFQDENFPTHFPQVYINYLINSLFAYKIASKYLSKTGLIILSCNEKQFLKVKAYEHEQYGRGREKPDEVRENKRTYTASNYMTDGAIAYLGLILGERYDLSLNSRTVIALSSELSKEQPQPIATFYVNWVNNKGVPSPGSFARFQPPNDKTTTYYVEYL